MFKKIKLNLFILVFSFILIGCISDVDENNNRNYDLYSKIMCPVCDGQTIGESQASIANDMKNIVDAYISDGKTDDEILKYFEDRYGTEILSAPPNSGSNAIVWITPFILISLSFIIFSGWLKKSVKGNS
ncbi:MAG: cytochrome c-type biogenesis protein CcmH [Chloroflexota bacterium]|nr:cytochrome c-type biogenesis protein CcmH [Chloroflexota bacterium]GIS28419.1 MAG: cytochrome C-type biogenesis protein [Chloroflexota bacterium]|tara:strand:- start:124 stop:513 length:390 start_codon:yes stop_codon:yes gene_type:complete